MNAQITLVFILTLTGSCIGYHVWTTTYDEPFEIFCGEPEMLTSMTSIHSDGNEDRKWEFVCDSTSLSYMLNRQLQCSWSGYINDYDQPAIYQCSQTGFIQGIKSVHHNGAEDRRWDFYCCSSPAYSVTDCRYTSQLNRYDKPLQYYIPDGYVLHGAISVHHDGAESHRRLINKLYRNKFKQHLHKGFGFVFYSNLHSKSRFVCIQRTNCWIEEFVIQQLNKWVDCFKVHHKLLVSCAGGIYSFIEDNPAAMRFEDRIFWFEICRLKMVKSS